MKALSVMFALVTDASNRSLELEIETVFEDGTVSSLRVPARKSLRVDLDTLYAEARAASPSIPPAA